MAIALPKKQFVRSKRDFTRDEEGSAPVREVDQDLFRSFVGIQAHMGPNSHESGYIPDPRSLTPDPCPLTPDP